MDQELWCIKNFTDSLIDWGFAKFSHLDFLYFTQRIIYGVRDLNIDLETFRFSRCQGKEWFRGMKHGWSITDFAVKWPEVLRKSRKSDVALTLWPVSVLGTSVCLKISLILEIHIMKIYTFTHERLLYMILMTFFSYY